MNFSASLPRLALAALLSFSASGLMAAPAAVPPLPSVTRPVWLSPVLWYDVDPASWSQADAERIQREADAGDAQAQYFAGVLREDGKRVPRDLPAALHWYELSAAQGNASAQASLGRMLVNGWATPKDNAKAVEWNTKAATQDNRRAIYNQGFFARRNLLSPGGETVALDFYARSSELGMPHGALEMARHYRSLKGNSAANVQGWAWLERATKAGFAPALLVLDQWCNETPQWPDCGKIAPGALVAAAEAGYDPAQLRLGLRLWSPFEAVAGWSEGMRNQLVETALDTPGMGEDKLAGAQWLNRAARGGNKLAFYNIAFVLEAENEKAKYQTMPFQVASVGTIRTCYYEAAADGVPQAMMSLLISLQQRDDKDIFTEAERETVIDYWTGKIGETGAFEKNQWWAVQYSDWKEKIGTPAPSYLKRGMGNPEDCAILPVAQGKRSK
jgi:TPR repeat protein